MKISTRKITWMNIGFALALLAGAPAVADDTELFLLNPDPSLSPKPNVLFILDTSGSMTTTQLTLEPYDSAEDYPGACDSENIYWTNVDVTPVCDGSETAFFAKTAFQCDFAGIQVAGIGSFTNTMVQFRPDASGANRWTTLQPGNKSDDVECQADSGIHGDGMANFVYAAAGSGMSNAWTDDPTRVISWGSSGVSTSYTVFDGNYLNWQESPNMVELSRSDIMKAVTSTVLSSVNNLNVGLMRFDGNDGGPVILDMTDLDANRQDILDAIDDLPASGNTPLSEVLPKCCTNRRSSGAACLRISAGQALPI